MAEEAMTFMVEDARILFRNFAGQKTQYNAEGARNFSVVLTDEMAEKMLADGWNVKFLAPREEDEAPTPYIQVKVNFSIKPPRVVMITSTARTHLGPESISVLDWADIKTCDLIARAYNWEVNGKTGISAYLQSMFITIEEDELERKYALQEQEGISAAD